VRAWWAYWLTIGVAAILWIGVPLIVGREGVERDDRGHLLAA